MSNYLETGKIVGTFGINGELKVLSDATTNRFVKGNTLYLGKNTKSLEKVEITSARFHKGMYLVTINNLNNINLVEKYVNFIFYIDRDEMNDLKENEYYFVDLIGLKIVDTKSTEYGVVTDMLDLPSSSVLEANINGKKILIPFVKNYIKEVTNIYIMIDHLEEFLWNIPF